MKKIAILGCGHGGQALAGHLSFMGHEVSLYAHPEHPGAFNAIYQQKGIYLTGEIEGFATIHSMHHEIQPCIEGAAVILMALPAFACDQLMYDLVPYLSAGQILVNLAGYFSSIFAHQLILNSPYEKDIRLAELTSFPYACRTNHAGSVHIVATKQFVGIASIHKNQIHEIIDELSDVIPCPLRAKSSVLEVGLYNTSGIGHTPAILFNAARIGNQDSFYFYNEGISEETAQVLMRLDQERLLIGSKLGYVIPPHYEVLNKYYGHQFSSIYDYFKKSPIHNSIPFFPTSTKTRYVREDVPFILVPWLTLAESLGIQAKGIKTLIDAMSLLHNTDYLAMGRKFNPELIASYQ